MLNTDVGELLTVEGEPAILTLRDVTGHALYGPYVHITPGRHAVSFRIAAEEGTSADADTLCAIVDVCADAGQRPVAAERVRFADLATGQPVRLEFDVAEPLDRCEFRVWTSGAVRLRVADVAVLEPRAGEAPPASPLAAAAARGAIDPRMIQELWQRGVAVDVRADEIAVDLASFGAFREGVLLAERDRHRLAEMVVGSVGYRGCSENSLFRAFVGTERPLATAPQPIPLASSLCHQAHFGFDQYRFWLHALKEQPRFQRKQWEFFFVAQALYERGLLEPGRSGLVFGAGEEQLPALFASFGARILATDQAPEDAVRSGWADSGQYSYNISALNQRGICTDRMFSDLVSFMPVDMNDIPHELDGRFDFCWSACAFEHLGSLRHGLDFVRNSIRTLRPGGVAVHTTEYNLSSNDDTVETEGLSVYRRRDIETLIAELTADGCEVAPIDWELGEGFAEMVVDVAPFLARGEPHIRLRIGQYDCTSIGLIITKPA